jgi:hypothetical protein
MTTGAKQMSEDTGSRVDAMIKHHDELQQGLFKQQRNKIDELEEQLLALTRRLMDVTLERDALIEFDQLEPSEAQARFNSFKARREASDMKVENTVLHRYNSVLIKDNDHLIKEGTEQAMQTVLGAKSETK